MVLDYDKIVGNLTAHNFGSIGLFSGALDFLFFGRCYYEKKYSNEYNAERNKYNAERNVKESGNFDHVCGTNPDDI